MKNKKNKCEELKFQHNWRDITPNIVYATYPPTYPNKREQCNNCGLGRELIVKTEKHYEYSDKRDHEEYFDHSGAITITSSDNLAIWDNSISSSTT